MPPTQNDDVSSPMSKLSLDAAKNSDKPGKKKAKKVVADSWEDEDVSSESESGKPSATAAEEGGGEGEGEGEGEASSSKKPSAVVPSAPLPTPMSPVGTSSWPDPTSPRAMAAAAADPDKRPEKTDAVARRMIAAGLGLRAPKQTEEQKAYQRSVRERERKKRERERAEEQKRKEDAEKAKAAIWDD